jgi:hypothetical protein
MRFSATRNGKYLILGQNNDKDIVHAICTVPTGMCAVKGTVSRDGFVLAHEIKSVLSACVLIVLKTLCCFFVKVIP